MTDYRDVVRLAGVLAEAVGGEADAAAVWPILDAVLGEAVGHRLFTVLIHDGGSGTVTRCYSSRPEEYPVQGSKQMGPTPWGDLLLVRGKPFLGIDEAGIRWAFPDHDLILSMALGSAINLPVRVAGRTLGTLNLLHEAGHYRGAHLETGALFAAIVAPLMQVSG